MIGRWMNMNKKPGYNFQNIGFIVLLVIITLFFFYIVKPFFFAVFWAALIAGIFMPLHRALNTKITNPNLCAGATLVVILLCLIIPIAFLFNLLVLEAFDIYKSFDSQGGAWMKTLTATLNTLSQSALFAKLNLDQAFILGKFQDIIKAVSGYVINHISNFTQNTILVIVKVAVMIYTLFYFLRDGERLLESMVGHIPVNKRYLDTFIYQFLSTAKASLKFTFVIGGIQGFLGGLVFYITGIERALIWGVIMMGLSILPGVGCAFVWVPAGIIMLVLGHTWQGIVILIFGSVIISSVDNLLRPVLLGRDTNMHALLIFLSTLGGLAVLGLSGFVMGPIIAALFLASWKLFLEFYQEKQEEKIES
ncbi:MAG: putative inner membrane protein [Deltaproteobacteria bacterium ADurb.Bin022]|nr:MAG: putative inner membrane protein [Deltaproteobacteria bacterium ADurb.Bin022]